MVLMLTTYYADVRRMLDRLISTHPRTNDIRPVDFGPNDAVSSGREASERSGLFCFCQRRRKKSFKVSTPERDDHHEGVGEVEQRRHELLDVELRVEVEDAVGEYIDGRTARHEEGSPPPVVVLCAELYRRRYFVNSANIN
jgi:hypothetical protein